MKKIVFSLMAAVFFLILAGAGCTNQEAKKEETSKTESEVKEYDKNWTSKKDQSEIKTTPIAGKINDKDVTIADVQIKKWDNEYSWAFSNIKADEACGVIIDNDAVNFSSTRLEEGTFQKKMEDEIDFDTYHSYYQYEQADGTPMSVNVGWAAKIVVNKIDQTNKKVEGLARFEFDDGKTAIEGTFTADLCE